MKGARPLHLDPPAYRESNHPLNRNDMAKTELPILQPTRRPKLKYDCSKCPGYCCTYDWIPVTRRDIARLGKRFGLDVEAARKKFTKYVDSYGRDVLRHRKDHIYKTACQFLDQTTRRCTVYEHRPAICRQYPEENRCGYYDFLSWEREHQDDPDFIPLHR
jgi:Fe-S-cluster containining protein